MAINRFVRRSGVTLLNTVLQIQLCLNLNYIYSRRNCLLFNSKGEEKKEDDIFFYSWVPTIKHHTCRRMNETCNRLMLSKDYIDAINLSSWKGNLKELRLKWDSNPWPCDYWWGIIGHLQVRSCGTVTQWREHCAGNCKGREFIGLGRYFCG